jgi:hypothetical protein
MKETTKSLIAGVILGAVLFAAWNHAQAQTASANHGHHGGGNNGAMGAAAGAFGGSAGIGSGGAAGASGQGSIYDCDIAHFTLCEQAYAKLAVKK